MNATDFDRLYGKGREHRRKFATASGSSPLAAFFTRPEAHPPVIGFGLPTSRLPQPLVVTVGINPSTNEFVGRPPPLPLVDDPEVQWKAQTNYFVPSRKNAPYEEWFSLSARFLRASGLAPTSGTNPCSPYSEGLAVHLDLSPVVTNAFTQTMSAQIKLAKKAGDRDREAAIKKSAVEMLSDGLREVLAPALTAIRKVNDISCIVVFGCSLRGAGTPVINEVLRDRLVPRGTTMAVGDATVGWAESSSINIEALPESLRALALSAVSQQAAEPDFASLPIALVSQSPSYWRRQNTLLTTIDEIGRACRRTRQQ